MRHNTALSPANRKIAITGVSRGIGLRIAEYLASKGHRIFGCARTNPVIRWLDFRRVNLREPASIKSWTQYLDTTVGSIDLLINNAAILGTRRRFEDIDLGTWREVVETNILGTIFVTRAILPLLKRSDNGAIVINMGSIMGKFGRAGWSTYCVSKFSLEGLTQVLAQELARDRIRVVALHPSRVSTELRRSAYPTEPELPAENTDKTCRAVDWILTKAADCHSGQSFSVADLESWA